MILLITVVKIIGIALTKSNSPYIIFDKSLQIISSLIEFGIGTSSHIFGAKNERLSLP